MRSPESEVLRLKEEVQALQLQLADALKKRTVMHGVPERDHAKALSERESEIERLHAVIDASIPKAEHRRAMALSENQTKSLRAALDNSVPKAEHDAKVKRLKEDLALAKADANAQRDRISRMDGDHVEVVRGMENKLSSMVPKRDHYRVIESHERERERWAKYHESMKEERDKQVKALRITIDRLETEVNDHRDKDQGAEIAALESKVVRLEQVNSRLAMDNAAIRRSLKERIDSLEHEKSSLQNRLRRIEQCR